MNVRDVDLNLLRVFDAVLHEKGVTPAALRLGLTQPAVSNALARLRKLFGDPLFVRTPGGVDATPFARELAEPVRQALALESMNDVWRKLNAEETKKQAESGIQAIKFDNAFREKAYEVAWAAATKQSPEHAPQMRKLFSK